MQAARHGNQATCQMRAAKLAGGEDGQVEILYKFKFKVSVYRQTICDMEKNYSHTSSSKAEAYNMVKDHSLKQSGSTCLNSPIDTVYTENHLGN
jgi:hypothetical protein